ARWQISTRGEYYAAGIRGPITGRRADLAIIDDPIKSQADADSPSLREHIWNWYRSDLLTRLKPRARVVLVMTRWHEDDLGGRLLDLHPNEWRCLRLPALAEANDPLGRPYGTPLWPEWEDASSLARKRSAIGERAWAALFQQTPHPPDGNLFAVKNIQIVDTPPAPAGRVVRAWDLAATEQAGGTDPDWTVGLKLTRDATGRFIILDILRLRGSPNQVEDLITKTAAADGPSVTIGIPQDPGQAGKVQVTYLTSRLAGFHVSSSRESGAKATRAMPVASQLEAGNLAIVRAPWNGALLEELRNFPHGAKDDQVDALSRAFAMLTATASPARRLNVLLMAR
ncbi:MAG: phage terminase large subunit, partial [Acetobacteraceae bacterium]|nr:phage terminase large subunit [Acetobacteraceae bacterium]